MSHSSHTPAPVLISLTSFGAAEVGRHGQLWFARLSVEAGADGVEVRGELLRDAARELPELAAWSQGTDRIRVYSSPDPLWLPNGELHTAALAEGLARAQTLRAPRLKMAIGDFAAQGTQEAARDFAALAGRLDGSGVELLIENDQTVRAGTLDALQRFFALADQSHLHLPMTFDMGNWHYQGECPLLAARAFGARVAYVHAKGVQRLPAKWVAVPLLESAAPWRSVLRSLPTGVPRAIEYPLAGDDLLAVTRQEIQCLRDAPAQCIAPP